MLSLLLGCSIFDPSLVDDAGPADTGATDTGATDTADADSDVTPDTGTGPVVGTAPPRPSADTEGPDIEPISVALRDVVLDQFPDRWERTGLNLDGINSQGEIPMAECVAPNGTSRTPEDGEDGIDNVFGAIIYQLVKVVLPNFESNSRASQLSGLGTFVIRIFGWNGTPNDPRVDVILTQAAGGTSADDPSDFLFDDEMNLVDVDGLPAPAPRWEGSQDAFFGRSDNFLMGNENQPITRDDNGYVSNGTLVMRLPDRVDILFFGSERTGARVRLTDATALAQINDEFGFDEATVAGRWSILDLLDTGENLDVCVGDANRILVERSLDQSADVRAVPGTGGEGVACNAISVGVSFSGRRARWAGLGPSRELPNACDLRPPEE